MSHKLGLPQHEILLTSGSCIRSTGDGAFLLLTLHPYFMRDDRLRLVID